jgi:beta-lactamase class A
MVNRKTVIISVTAVAVLAAAVLGGVVIHRQVKEAQRQRALLEKRKVLWQSLTVSLREEISRFQGEAGVVVKDLKTGWEFSSKDEVPMPAASVVKVPLMAACFKAQAQGKLDFSELKTLGPECKTPGSGDLDQMPCGLKISVEKLVQLMITTSDNTAANMLTDTLGMEYINGFFREAGLEHTNLSRKMMDFEARSQGVENYTTARDMARILESFYRKQVVSRAASEKGLQFLVQQKVRDRLPARLPEDALVAHKTGLERSVCHDCGIIAAPQGDFLVCILTRLAPNTRQAKRFIASVALDVYNAYQDLERGAL